MKLETKESVVDLTDLAVGIVVLGVIVSIGATILINMRNTRLTELSTFRTSNETASIGSNSNRALDNIWFKGVVTVYNESGNESITSGNYTVSTNQFGYATLTNTSTSPLYNSNWNVTYDSYNTSRADFAVPNSAAIGLAEYGNWFKIIVIVGVAAVVLSLIFMAFGRNTGGSSGGGIGGEY